MAAYRGGEQVKAGFFFNLDSWELTAVSGREGGTLEGTAAVRYRRVPVLAMLTLAPLMGAAFAIFLPFIGIFLMGQFLAGKAWHGVQYAGRALVGSLGPAWHPASAHLSGGPDQGTGAKTDERPSGTQTALDALEREIVERGEQDRTER